MALIKPVYVALDSSQLGNWARDRDSTDDAIRAAALDFETEFLQSGFILVVTFHHIDELLAHSDAAVRTRLALLKTLPLVAWPHLPASSMLPGGISDIMAAEIEAAVHKDTAEAVRDQVAQSIFKVGTGEEALSFFDRHWKALQPHFRARAEQDRDMVALTRSAIAQGPDITVRDLKRARFGTPEAIAKRMAEMGADLALEVRERGDRRIENPDAVAAGFVSRINAMASTLTGSVADHARRALALQHVDLDELGQDAKFTDLTALGLFRQKLRGVAEEDLRHIPWSIILERATPDRLPYALLERGLRDHGQDLPERKGSEVYDRYLATLAFYTDLTYVDRRTQEDLRRARQAIPELNRLLRQTEKVSGWPKVKADILSLDTSVTPATPGSPETSE